MAKMITEHSALQPVRHRLTEISNEALRWSGMVLITIVWTSVVALAACYIADKVLGGMRVDADQERQGLDIHSHGETAYQR